MTWTPLSESFMRFLITGRVAMYGKENGAVIHNTILPQCYPGLTQYKTPFDSCHNHGYIILITDGAPTHGNTAANSLIQNEYINGLNQAELTTWGKSFSYKDDNTQKQGYLPLLVI